MIPGMLESPLPGGRLPKRLDSFYSYRGRHCSCRLGKLVIPLEVIGGTYSVDTWTVDAQWAASLSLTYVSVR